MKYIVLSFDDGREDFYTNALPIIKKNRLTATLNVVTDFIGGHRNASEMASADNKFVSWEEVKECEAAGIEIASHSSNHTNAIDKIRKADQIFRRRNISGYKGGFASPNSCIWSRNIKKYGEVGSDGAVSYIRSGNQLRRDGKIRLLYYLVMRFTGSRYFFCLYHKRNIIKLGESLLFYPSVSCDRNTTVKQIVKLIQGMKDGEAAILLFHSILKPSDPGYGKDKWYTDERIFRAICSYISREPGIKSLTNFELHNLMKEQV